MEKFDYISIRKYLKKRNLKDAAIFVGKTRKSFIIGPKINNEFDEESFYKRLIASSVYSSNMYKTVFRKKTNALINEYYEKLNNNEMIEIYKNGEIVSHKIIKLSGDMYEKE